MFEFFSQAVSGFFQQSAIELVAVAFALVYLVLAIRQNIWCWPAAFISTVLFVWVFFDVSLFMESLLNVYYMAMAIYGYWSWTHGKSNKPLAITFWKPKQHIIALAIIGGLTLFTGHSLQSTGAAWPYLDSFTTWGAVVTTYMVARKIFENWLYWLVIDSVALFLYLQRGLYPTGLLMMFYLVLVIVGIVSWSKQLKKQQYEIEDAEEGALA